MEKYIFRMEFEEDDVQERFDAFNGRPDRYVRICNKSKDVQINLPQRKINDYVKEQRHALSNTVELMLSGDYKDRFIAELMQIKSRYNGLKNMLNKWDSGKLTFIPACPRETYNFQLRAMKDYMDILVVRAKIEGIAL